MPNWCDNTVEIYHKDPAMLERVRSAFADGRLLDEFIPVPADLKIVAGSVGAKGSPEQDALEAKEQANREKHGYATWYDYCVNEWGTKWDIGGDGEPAQDIPGGLMLSFQSAWAPPCGAYEKLEELGFSIRATYYEPGMCFAGIWENGNDDYYEYGSMSSEEVREAMPVELDEAYGISEYLAECEEEEKEEEND